VGRGRGENKLVCRFENMGERERDIFLMKSKKELAA